MNVLTRLKMNMMSIIGWTIKIAGALFGILSTLLLFVSWDEVKATDQLFRFYLAAYWLFSYLGEIEFGKRGKILFRLLMAI